MVPVEAHMQWRARDGAPGNIAAMTQTSDGFLWLGTPLGLYRFDGLQFSAYPMTPLETSLPSSDIDALSSDPDGGLWIGFRITGGICHLGRNGDLTSYNPANHLGPQSAQKIFVAKDGTVWAIGDNRLQTLRDGKWVNFGVEHGLPDEDLWNVYMDRQGAIWASVRHRLFVLRRGDKNFGLYDTPNFIIVDMAEMPGGQLWISDGWHMVRPLSSTSPRDVIQVKGYTRTLIDPSGTLWMAQDYRGVSHLRPTGTDGPSKLIKEAELTSEQTDSILRDRDGNIWIGTSRGLDRFQPSTFKAISNTRVEYYPALAADLKTGVWIAMLAHPLLHASGEHLNAIGPNIGSSPVVLDENGRVWLVDPIRQALTVYDHGKVLRTPVPAEIHQAAAQSIGLDYDGAILISFDGAGLWRFSDRWKRLFDPTLPAQHPLSIFRDNNQQVWLGYSDGQIVMRDKGGFRRVPAVESASLGNVLTFAVIDRRIWAGGSDGVSYYEQGVFRRLPLKGRSTVRGVSGIVEDKTGAVWLNASTGIIRIAASAIGSLSFTSTDLNFELLDDRQGVEGTAAQVKPTPSATADKNGQLWFSTSGEVYSLDPGALSLRNSVPRLSIERAMVNGASVEDREHHLASVDISGVNLKELEIDYIGIDLTAPEKVSYQYMLEGEDKTWREVGDRRQAFYSHLRPGTYRFHLRANGGADRKWVELVLSTKLIVAPAFYQTIWFYLLAVAVLLAMLYMLYLLRVQYLTNRLRERLGERASERSRIARDLHDTLLQSIHGLMLRFDVAVQKLPQNDPARQSLETALTRADRVYVETRRQVESLRDEVQQNADLPSLISRRSEEMEISNKMKFRIVETGRRQLLQDAVLLELDRIAAEAINNTLRHSGASSAEVVIDYGTGELLMRCCDTGSGLPAQVVAKGSRAGHWGLVGMRERAAAIDGKFQIWSLPSGGTEIEVRVPARQAYRHPHTRFPWLHRMLQFRRTATGLETIDEPES